MATKEADDKLTASFKNLLRSKCTVLKPAAIPSSWGLDIPPQGRKEYYQINLEMCQLKKVKGLHEGLAPFQVDGYGLLFSPSSLVSSPLLSFTNFQRYI
jgi:hypothetical protein